MHGLSRQNRTQSVKAPRSKLKLSREANDTGFPNGLTYPSSHEVHNHTNQRQHSKLSIGEVARGSDFIALRQTLAGNQSPNESSNSSEPSPPFHLQPMIDGLTGKDISLSVSKHEQQIDENGESGMKG
ncbi:hypothetical protein V6N11_081617 [Hibiscus sabdariffa]|uniref:Uncharacterized protein n=1 Tax=Hibiscus sabdariffa TaxID=183260 RepID=A0ABR2N8S3_9ROSI